MTARSRSASGRRRLSIRFLRGRLPALRVALRALSANKARALLTMLGIIIGVAAVVLMVSLGTGAGSSVNQSIQGLGTNLLTISPGSSGGGGAGARSAVGSGTTLTVEDAEAISKEVIGVEELSPEYSSNLQLVNGAKNISASVVGVTPAYASVRNAPVEAGRFIDSIDVNARARVAVLGRNLVHELFEGQNPVGRKLRVGEQTVQVVGVLKAKGGAGFTSPDDGIYIPLTTAQSRFFGVDNLSQIGVQVKEADAMDDVQSRITAVLLARHGISNQDEADFRIFNQADVLESLGAVTGVFTVLLAGIASVSLLVGGIGIMNIMLVSVTERTREIGLRKALGARKADILRQFLTESILLSVVGGALGVAIGVGGSLVLGPIIGFTMVVSPISVALAFVFAVLVGVFFGVFPALRAARLRPIEALRFE